MEIGDCIPSANDLSYQRYSSFCRMIGQPAATYEAWLNIERAGFGFTRLHVSSVQRSPMADVIARRNSAKARRLGRVSDKVRQHRAAKPAAAPVVEHDECNVLDVLSELRKLMHSPSPSLTIVASHAAGTQPRPITDATAGA
jgi:hypothetical protein